MTILSKVNMILDKQKDIISKQTTLYYDNLYNVRTNPDALHILLIEQSHAISMLLELAKQDCNIDKFISRFGNE